ncbi:MAG: cobalt-precorrin-6A reductase [Mycobacterium sp.]|nr:cobalt-precorrin-6A reductase [Mycobacterium sp.]
MRVLLLGGTAEARTLAARLNPHVDVISSLAGRVPDPALPAGQVRIGGFGGVDGMRQWLCDEHVDAVVDATHPFAATITAHAAQVCRELGLPHLVLTRPPWDPGDAIVVASDAEAAKRVEQQSFQRVFLTTGRSGVAAFADSKAWFLIRAVTAPDFETLPRRHQLVLSRGPYHYDGEHALLREHRIDVLVTKNSGGKMTRAKLDAAAALGIPVVMVARPPLPAAVTTVGTVEEAAEWAAGKADAALRAPTRKSGLDGAV